MSVDHQTFVERCLSGQVLANEVDDVIDAWHDGDDPRTLREFLGFNELEYTCWMKDASCVYDILACRNENRPFTGEREECRWGMAARGDGEMVDISAWLPKE